MGKYRVQKQFFQWDETVVEADSLEEAFDYAQDNWQDLPVEGVGDYEPTGTWFVIEDETGDETSIYA